MQQPIKSLQLGDLDSKQPLLFLPQSFADQFPNDYVAEYRERSSTLLEVTLVNPKSPAGNKRYRVFHHHGASQVSIPKVWLRDKLASAGEHVDIYQDGLDPKKLVLTLRRFYPAGGAVI